MNGSPVSVVEEIAGALAPSVGVDIYGKQMSAKGGRGHENFSIEYLTRQHADYML